MIHFRDRVGEYSGEGQGMCANGKGTKIYSHYSYTGDWIKGRKDGKGTIRTRNSSLDLKFSDGHPIKIYNSSKLENFNIAILTFTMPLALENNQSYYEEIEETKVYYIYIDDGKFIFNGKIFEENIKFMILKDGIINYIGEDIRKNFSFGEVQTNYFSYCGYHNKLTPEGKGILYNKNEKISYKGNFINGRPEGLVIIKDQTLRASVNYVDGVPSGNCEFNFEGNIHFRATFNNVMLKLPFSLSDNEKIISKIQNSLKSIPLLENHSTDKNQISLSLLINSLVYNLELKLINRPHRHNHKNKQGVYFGEEEFGKCQGKGRMVFDNGDVYCGQWKDNRIEGVGKYFYKDSSIYFGEFRSNKRHGIGLMTFNNKTIYKGLWKDDLMHGKGTFKTPSFEICGIWEHNRLKSSAPSRLFSPKPIS